MNKDKNCYYWLARAVVPMFLVLLITAWMPGCGSSGLDFPSEYQAVFMDNGQIFYGKLADKNSSFLMLQDAYSAKTMTNQEKKETKLIMVPRSLELHNPDFMCINTRHVVVIEPVGPESHVAQLIREAKLTPLSRVMPPPAVIPTQTPAPTPNSTQSKEKTVPSAGR